MPVQFLLFPRRKMGFVELLQRTPAFANAEPAVLTRLASCATARTLRRGELLWQAGERPRAITVIRAGLIKLVHSDGRGRSAIRGLFGVPDTVCDLAALQGVAYPGDAIGLTEVTSLIVIPRELVLEAVRMNPELALSLACAANAELAALHAEIDVLSAGSVEARMATLLLKLYERFGDDFDDGCSRIPVHLSRRELADLVSTSFETAIRVMTRWERHGVVATEAGGFVLHNLQALDAFAGHAPAQSLVVAAE